MEAHQEERVVLVNFSFVPEERALVSIHDRPLECGASLYEVIKVRSSAPLFLRPHLARLLKGMQTLDFPWLAMDKLKESLVELVKRNELESGLIYLQVSRGCSPREHTPPKALTPSFWAYTKNVPFPLPKERIKGLNLISLPDTRWYWACIKTTNLLPNVMAKAQAKTKGADEALFLGPKQEIREAASANIFFVKDQTILTPRLTPHILPGISRLKLLSFLKRWGIKAYEADLTLKDALEMEEAFLTATSYEIYPIVRLDSKTFSSNLSNSLTLGIMERFESYIQAFESKHSSLRTLHV
jgi:D-alanine transaminase